MQPLYLVRASAIHFKYILTTAEAKTALAAALHSYSTALTRLHCKNAVAAMPLGGKALKRREQAKDAKNGVVRDELALRKAANAKADVHCTVCAVAFKLTKRNVDQRAHVESKHPGKTFAECFPECVAHEKALAEGGGSASNKNPNKGGVGKTGGKKKSKDEDLSALLSEGLSVGGKKKGKK